MERFLARILFLSFAFVCLLHGNPASAQTNDWAKNGWEFLNETDGVKVYRKSYPDSAVKGVGGEAVIDAPLSKLLWVLMDHAHKKEWIDRFREARTVEEISPLVHIQYAAFSMPFPVSDRDFVYRYEFKVDPELNGVVVDVKSVQNEKEPVSKDGTVRGEIVAGKYILIPEGDKTLVKAEYLADPKGSLPTWVVNLVQKKWPLKTLVGLREQVKKPFVQDWNYYATEIKPKLR